jgi:hypothetical protein
VGAIFDAQGAPVDVIESPFGRNDVVATGSQYGGASQSRLEFVMASIESRISAELNLSGPFRRNREEP